MKNGVALAVLVVLALCGSASAGPVTTSNVRDASEPLPLSSFLQCQVQCPFGALQENEPVCYDGYIDNYNGGCNSDPYVFQTLLPSCATITLCGTSGVYNAQEYRDTDWFQIAVTETIDLSFCCIAEFPLLIFVIDGNAGCGGLQIIGQSVAPECQQACIQMQLQPGTYWLWVGPSEWSPIPCGSHYVMTVDGYSSGTDYCCVIPPALDFGSVDVGRYLDKDFTIVNTWGEPLIGTVSEACDFYSIVSGGGDYSLAPGESLTVTVRFAPTLVGPQTCQISTGMYCPAIECLGTGEPRYCSFPCWNWTGSCLGMHNRDISTLPACIRDDHFSDVFPNGLSIGIDGPGFHEATWTSAVAVEAFRCGYGLPAPLNTNYVDPASYQLGAIYGDVMALRLNREFSCSGYFTEISKCLGTAIVPPEVPKFAGITVDELLGVADQALAGNTDALLPYGNSFQRLQMAVDYMNQLYADCGDLIREPPIKRMVDGGDDPEETTGKIPSHVLVTSHPNPLETGVTIILALPTAGEVSMGIYDVQGRRVAGMASQYMAEGCHNLFWNGADDSGTPVASGMYFVLVRVDGQTAAIHKLTKL